MLDHQVGIIGIRLLSSRYFSIDEHELIDRAREIALRNKIWRSYIGMGYHNCYVPHTIMRNIFENPGWTTQYTPYQPEISQGRLESLLNYQTMVSEMTGLDVSNASLLDEGTAAAEAMTLCTRHNKRKKIFISERVHPQTLEIIRTRVDAMGLEMIVGPIERCDLASREISGVLIQYPDTCGNVVDYADIAKTANKNGVSADGLHREEGS